MSSSINELIITVDTNAGETPMYSAISRALVKENAAGKMAGIEFHINRSRLDLGDVCIEWTPKDKPEYETYAPTTKLLIERKTWSDWCASISDNRYREQKQRFIATANENTRLIYLIEGTPVDNDGQTRGMQHSAANAALIKTQLRDGFAVLWSNGPVHSGNIISYLALTLTRNGFAPSKKASQLIIGADRNKCKRKRDNLVNSVTETFCATLTMVPDVSDARARAIQAAFATPRDLLNASELQLADIKCGKQRLGPVIAKRLKQLYC